MDHPHVGITLDFGHACGAAAYLRQNYRAALETAAPLVNHLHIYDSVGRPNTMPREPYMYEVIYGMGDLHIPLGWGTMDFETILPELAFPPCVMMIELKARYVGEIPPCVRRARELVALVGCSQRPKVARGCD